jgi:hypothetical protein
MRIEVKQTSHLTPPNNPNMSSVVVLVFSFGRLVACVKPSMITSLTLSKNQSLK